MGEHVIKLPDVGEGVAEAELVEWHVKVGDPVREDQVLAAVMTDKATVEVPSPVDGTVLWLGAEIGDTVAIGSPIVRLEVAGEGNVGAGNKAVETQLNPVQTEALDTPTPGPSPQRGGERSATSAATIKQEGPSSRGEDSDGDELRKESPSLLREGARGGGSLAPASHHASRSAAPRPEGEKPLASPAVRSRAKEAGIDLRRVPGSGPAGRITHEDIDAFLAHGAQAPLPGGGLARKEAVEDIKIVGLRRKIAEKMQLAKARIPHITYVEEIDVTALEDLRAALNKEKKPAPGGAERPKLTLLPFLMRAMVKAIGEQPQMNALFDDEAGVIHRHAGIHVGIAAQTPGGLVVPVVHHAEARGLWDCAAEINRLAEAARSGTASRDELSGSTITITSLGAMGGVVTTPVINHPEVAIVGVNKMMVRPLWDGAQFVPRKMMNLSSSFDHRVIDGWDAAVFIQRIKALLETPALIFVDE